jgi:crotonobetainyl-CoA:carnitine CoA-transferase CaiB-like acyl-CoA transferase
MNSYAILKFAVFTATSHRIIWCIPIKLEKSHGRIGRPAPELGEHTSEILASLGYSRGEIQSFKTLKVV